MISELERNFVKILLTVTIYCFPISLILVALFNSIFYLVILLPLVVGMIYMAIVSFSDLFDLIDGL